MNEFLKYLHAIGMNKPLIDKVKKYYDFYIPIFKIYGEKIEDIFISEYSLEEGERIYENIWFFSKKLCGEVKQFNSEQENIDITPLYKHIIYWNIKKSNYDFNKASKNSSLYIEFRFGTKVIGSLRASKENCNFLRDIFYKHIAPNLEE